MDGVFMSLDRTLKRWEIALILGVLCALLCGFWLGELAQAGQSAVEAAGYDYPVTASLEKCWFPTKEYDGFALPAGEYIALRVVIGEGAGQNWWCVAFPPLCLGAASGTVDEAAAAGYFSEDQAALITEENQGYVLKFRSMELLGELQGFLFG